MGAGMASYIEASAKSTFTMSKWEDYDLYCHFVAGLVGEGVSRIFSESSMERSWLGEQLTLSNHMGLFLQKTNIIRDYAEDCAEGRHFWPKECWAAPGADFSSQADVAKGIVEISKGSRHYRAEGPEGQKAMLVLSTMLLDALRHSTKALDYLSLIREQSIFNFCAIPQIMAIATINAMMNNPDVFKRNVKIRKSQAVHLILKAVNPRDVSYVFLDYSAQMRQKLKPSDPNFIQWSIQLGKVSHSGRFLRYQFNFQPHLYRSSSGARHTTPHS
jgi:farnesyl-diphosphate farnesyltransferase